MNDYKKFTISDWVVFVGIMLTLLFSLMSACRGDDIADARSRLKAIEAEKQQLETIAKAKAEQELQQLSPPELLPEPIERRAPVITFARPVQGAPAERLPRAVLVTGQGCAPCLRMETENADLIGGPDAPIQLVQNWLANDLDKWGLNPGMQIYGTPYVFILDKGGKIHSLTTSGLGCRLPGYHSREALLQYLTQPDHGVDITPAKSVEPQQVIATVENAELSADTFAAVLSAHLVHVSGVEPDEPYTLGGLFDFELDVNDNARDTAAKLLQMQRITFASAGITVDWTGPSRSLTVRPDGLSISPPVKVTLNKWKVSYSCSLNGVTYTPDLSRVRLLLAGAPDLTVVLK